MVDIWPIAYNNRPNSSEHDFYDSDRTLAAEFLRYFRFLPLLIRYNAWFPISVPSAIAPVENEIRNSFAYILRRSFALIRFGNAKTVRITTNIYVYYVHGYKRERALINEFGSCVFLLSVRRN